MTRASRHSAPSAQHSASCWSNTPGSDTRSRSPKRNEASNAEANDASSSVARGWSKHEYAGRSGSYFATRGKAWSLDELSVLKTHRHLTARQLLPLLPRRTIKSIGSKRVEKGLTHIPPPARPRVRKGKPPLKRVGHPIIDAIIARCEEDKIGLRNLDREIGTGHYFQNKHKKFLLEPIAKAIAFFGGRGLMIDEDANVTIDWKDE